MEIHDALPVQRTTISVIGYVTATILGYVVPFLAPVVAILLLYRGYEWRNSSDPAQRRFSLLLLLLGVLMGAYSVLFVSGLVTDTTFVEGGTL
jgi:hypothetical protein